MRADYTWKDEDEPKEPEAVERRDGAMGFDPIHRLQLRKDVHAEAQRPCDLDRLAPSDSADPPELSGTIADQSAASIRHHGSADGLSVHVVVRGLACER